LFDSHYWKNNKYGKHIFVYAIFAISICIQIAAVSVHYYNYFYRIQIDQNIQFSLVQGKGVPSIAEPPIAVYFDWEKSPILMQFKYIKKIGIEMIDYEYTELPDDVSDREKVNAYPTMHMYDFWWIYMYYIHRSRMGFIGVMIYLIVIGVCGYRIKYLSRN